ncbi:oligosaccharide flippase family protein [Acidocella sp. KAb 2-4]|uniref:oligosaccharide flippase family protein n=1 Tax=Acidocella sp. KAb 2-4 TaxID=2885158 RepID=UPI001D06CC75|nr:oligosaccharide flippase family protein [Acidocella sp. KAb 2-4]MCB5945664.1 oligosaccharide flippase family protein [Acidocella sp. KAb 2-4]
MVTARLATRAVDLCTMLILARLLSPLDFGLIAIAMTLITLLEAALELPLSQALVQLPRIEPHHFHTAFTIGLLRGVALCVIAMSLALPFDRWYGHPELTPLIQALSLAPASRGLQNPRLAEYAKELNFKYEFYLEISGKALAFLAGSLTAYFLHTYWAIALCTIVAPASTTLMGYIILPYRPRLSLRDWRLFSDFLGWFSLSQIIMAVNFQSDQLLLGKLLPPAKLGLFSTANSLTYIPLTALFGPVLRPLLSAFTVRRDDIARLGQSYQHAASGIVSIGLPFLVGQVIIAQPLIMVLLGPKWLSAASLFEWLSISLIPYLFGLLLTPLSMALGQTHEIATRNMLQIMVKLPLVIIGAINYGFAGVIVARLISESVTALYCMLSIRKLCGLSLTRQFTVNLRAIMSCVAMLIVVLSLDRTMYFPLSPSWQLLRLTLLIGSGVISYAGCLLLSWRLAGYPEGLEAFAVRLLWRRSLAKRRIA